MTSSTCSLLVNHEKAGRFDTVKNDRFVAPAPVFKEILPGLKMISRLQRNG
jgi:hypothetical protein